MGLVCSGRDAGLESDPFRLLAFGCFLPFGDDDGVCPDAAALDFAIPIPTPGGLVTHPHLFSLIGTFHAFHAFRLPQPDNRCPGLWKMIGISYERSQHPIGRPCSSSCAIPPWCGSGHRPPCWPARGSALVAANAGRSGREGPWGPPFITQVNPVVTTPDCRPWARTP